MSDDSTPDVWWLAGQGQVHEKLLPYVASIEDEQLDYFDRFAMLEAMYDPNGPAGELAGFEFKQRAARMSENGFAAAVDTVTAQIAATAVRPRYMTDGADWSTQRRARNLGRYSVELGKRLDVDNIAVEGFIEAAKKGTGLAKIYADQDDELRVESVMVENIVVDNAECQNGAAPRQLHYRQHDCDRDWLLQQFPEHAAAINHAGGQGGGGAIGWARSVIGRAAVSRCSRNDVFVIESWRLPMGRRGTEDYVPGRHVICIPGADLCDEEWHDTYFPFAVMRWSKRRGSFYGIALGERVEGQQRILDKRAAQIDRQLDLVARPTTFVRQADANFGIKQTRIGTVIPIKGEAWPQTVVPNAVGPEVREDQREARRSLFEEAGVSQMAATGRKPAGVDAGVAIRELRDVASARFAMQERAFEQFVLDIHLHVLAVCKKLGAAAPKMSRQTRYGVRTIEWSKVDMGDVRVMIAAASTLSKTPAGRAQLVLELTQAGLFSRDDALRLLDHADIDHIISLFTAAIEAIEEDLEMIEDGTYVVPEPFINLKLAQSRGTGRYLQDRGLGAPEVVLEGLRTYVVQAAHTAARAPQPGGLGPAGGGPTVPPMAAPQQMAAVAPATLPPGLPAGP
jgi:hypothetical protein